MLVGRFGNTSGRPYLEGRLVTPRLGIRGDISFLVDTGADMTCLMPADAIRLAIPYNELVPSPTPTFGVGGATTDFVEQCIIAFADADTLYAYERRIHIAPNNPALMRLPALLGRDVIDNWRMTYAPRSAELSFDVRAADLVQPLADLGAFPPISPGQSHQ